MNLQTIVTFGSLIANNLRIIPAVLLVGYMGFRAVVWIKNKCAKTAVIQNLAQKIWKAPKPTENTLPPKKVSDLTVPAGVIKVGQGEYVLFRDNGQGKVEPITDFELYKQCYDVLEQHSPSALSNRPNGEEACQNRYELLATALAAIDPSIKAVFVPRTLFELIFIRECIEEDVNNNSFCLELWNLRSQHHYETDPEKRKKCFHLCKFTDARAVTDSNKPMIENLKDVAFRLNRSIFETLELSKHTEGLTYSELTECFDHHIQYMEDHHKKIDKLEGEELARLLPSGMAPPLLTFGCAFTRGDIKSMAFSETHCSPIARNAHTLDCSTLAATHCFLYRGAIFKKDSVAKGEACQSLSYGNGLFSGFMFDGGATAFHYVRWTQDAFAHPVPYSQINNSVFYVPNTNTLTGLYGSGEIFHGRTKAWKGTKPYGVQTSNPAHYTHLYTDLPKEEFIRQYNESKKEAFNLRA